MNSCNPHNAYNNTMFNCFIRIEVAAKNTCQYQYMNKDNLVLTGLRFRDRGVYDETLVGDT